MRNSSRKDHIAIRIDPNQREQLNKIAEDMGTDLPTMITMFFTKVIQENGLPFKPANDTTKTELDEALDDVKAGRVTTFTSQDDLFKHIHQLENTQNELM